MPPITLALALALALALGRLQKERPLFCAQPSPSPSDGDGRPARTSASRPPTIAATTTQPLAHHRAPCTLAQGPAAKRRSKDGEDRRTAEEPAAVLGFYSDPKHARPGSLAGARLTLNSSPNPITNPHTNPNPALSQTPTLTSIRQPEI